MAHQFGGPWTEIKLDAVEYYLQCYARALTAAKMDLWYVDAFAGTGTREEIQEVGGLFESQPIEKVAQSFDGSARRAIGVKPPFRRFVFVDACPDNIDALCKLREEFPDRDFEILQGDANKELKKFIAKPQWNTVNTRSRGVVFLDPYSMQVEWSTLISLARTKLMDVWYLFPLNAVQRQLALDFGGIGPKQAKLDLTLGPRWRELYSLPDQQPGLFQDDFIENPTPRRDPKAIRIEDWFRCVLADEFAYVSEPLPIMFDPYRCGFSLFLCVSNPSSKAKALAEQFATYVQKKFRPQH